MNLRQKKKLFKKITGYNPRGLSYGDSGYHAAINKPWGGLAEYKRLKATEAVEDFNLEIRKRNRSIRRLRRYTR